MCSNPFILVQIGCWLHFSLVTMKVRDALPSAKSTSVTEMVEEEIIQTFHHPAHQKCVHNHNQTLLMAPVLSLNHLYNENAINPPRRKVAQLFIYFFLKVVKQH